jgi:hypothetical protein
MNGGYFEVIGLMWYHIKNFLSSKDSFFLNDFFVFAKKIHNVFSEFFLPLKIIFYEKIS